MRPAIALEAPSRRGTLERLRDVLNDQSLAQTALLLVSFALFVVSWSFPWTVLADTPVLDVTLLEPTLIVGGLVLLAAGAWRLIGRADRPFIVLLAIYFGWLLVAAAARGSTQDIKQIASYLVFAGGALAIAFVSVRIDPARAARWLVAFFAVALVVALLGGFLERATAPAPRTPDPLAGFWSLFRPQQGLFYPGVGFMKPFPLHYPAGEAGLIRMSGVFAHPLYLGFFGLLAAALTTAMTLAAWRHGLRRRGVAFLVLVACAVVLTYATYSRAPLAAIVGVVGLAIVVDFVVGMRQTRRRPVLRDLLPGVLIVSTVIVAFGATAAADDLGVRRLSGSDILANETPEGATIEASAGRSAQLRLRMQLLALDMVTDSPTAMLVGPGVENYLVRLQDRGPNGIPGAPGNFNHPHSAWLTVMLAGGIPGALLFALLLGALWLVVVRALSRGPDVFRGAILLGLAAWIPVWAAAQLFGLHPLSSSEAVILGALIGIGLALSLGRDARGAAASTPSASAASAVDG